MIWMDDKKAFFTLSGYIIVPKFFFKRRPWKIMSEREREKNYNNP